MSTEVNFEITTDEIVANDFRAVSISKESGLDLCCWSHKNHAITLRS